MPGRIVQDLDAPPPLQPESAQTSVPQDLILHAPPNWTAAFFFACLAVLHLWNALSSFAHHRWAGHMSLILGIAFVIVAIVFSRVHYELSFLPRAKRIRIRTGLGPFKYQRFIGFRQVHAVRVTMSRAPDYPISRIEVLCDNEDIECPPTTIPRQEALCLAILMGVELIKVSDGGNDPQRNAEWSDN
jgi:hypothetical protein